MTTTVTRVGLECFITHISVSGHDTQTWVLDPLSDLAKRETIVRVRSALESSGEAPGSGWKFKFQQAHDDAPKGLRRATCHLDLPLAIALWSHLADVSVPNHWAFAGELSLGGDLRPIKGAGVMARALADEGYDYFVVPEENVAEVEAAGLPARGVRDLRHAICQVLELPDHRYTKRDREQPRYSVDFCEITIEPDTAWPFAVEVALAGGHSLLLQGAPGSGRTMIARRMSTCLTLDETTEGEVSDLYGIVGLPYQGQVPFRAPHHTISDVGMNGLGRTASPGEISLAHGGVLFLDDAPEFRRHTQEVVRHGYKNKSVSLANPDAPVEFPANFMLVGSASNCPCGQLGNPDRHCSCTSDQRDAYMKRLETYDFDIRVPVVHVPLRRLENADKCESSRAIRERVMAARQRQMERQGCLNGHLEKSFLLDDTANKLLSIARTIADLHQPSGPADEASDEITLEHLDLARELLNAN